MKAGEKIELPHHLALLATKKLVDQIMMEETREEEIKTRAENKNPYWVSPKGVAVGVPAAREPYEKKVLRELTMGESKITESQMGIIRSELKDTLTKDMKAAPAGPIESINLPKTEFEEINLPKSK